MLLHWQTQVKPLTLPRQSPRPKTRVINPTLTRLVLILQVSLTLKGRRLQAPRPKGTNRHLGVILQLMGSLNHHRMGGRATSTLTPIPPHTDLSLLRRDGRETSRGQRMDLPTWVTPQVQIIQLLRTKVTPITKGRTKVTPLTKGLSTISNRALPPSSRDLFHRLKLRGGRSNPERRGSPTLTLQPLPFRIDT